MYVYLLRRKCTAVQRRRILSEKAHLLPCRHRQGVDCRHFLRQKGKSRSVSGVLKPVVHRKNTGSVAKQAAFETSSSQALVDDQWQRSLFITSKACAVNFNGLPKQQPPPPLLTVATHTQLCNDHCQLRGWTRFRIVAGKNIYSADSS